MGRKAHEAAVMEFSHSVGMLVRRVRAAAVSGTDQMSWSETAVLKALAQHGAATTAELARRQGMRPQSMRPIVASLEEMGMVERKAHPTDGRQVNLELTAKGEAMHKRSGDAKRTWLAKAVGELDEKEQATLFAAGKILKRMAENDRQ